MSYWDIIKEYKQTWILLKKERNYYQADQMKARINKLKKRLKQCQQTGSL